MSKACIACPFRDGETLEATQGQNWGCLPSMQEMIEGVEKRGLALSCHDNDKEVCRGLIEAKPEAALQPIKVHEDWHRNGWENSSK